MQLDVLYNEDCLLGMKRIPDGSMDMILCDLPYAVTKNHWDSAIPFETLWDQYKRVTKKNAAIVLTASQPFSSALVLSQPTLFRHEWIWSKNLGGNFANTVREPMKEHESVLVFSRGRWTYNKQMQERSDSGKSRAKHPTQKPVALFEYLIRTYTNEGDTVLDSCVGSGTTAIACMNTGRRYIGFEKDPGYFAIAQKRIADHKPQLSLTA
jgi:site-specific DNA-methyltransferase (adenine-specific)